MVLAFSIFAYWSNALIIIMSCVVLFFLLRSFRSFIPVPFPHILGG